MKSQLASGTFNVISIIIPTLGRPSLERLERSIESVVSLSGLRLGRDVEVIVSLDRDCVGVNRARNEGARRSRGDILWFLDDDTELFNSDCFASLQRIFSDSSVAAAGGDYLSDERSRFAERGYNSLCSVWRSSAGTEDREQLLGGTLAVRKSSWESVGGFDEHIVYGGAETPFVQRLNRLCENPQQPAVRVILDSALDVLHRPPSRGVSGWTRVAFRQGRRQRETSANMPETKIRIRRLARALQKHDAKTVVSLAMFSVPFLAASRFGVMLSR